MSLTIHLHSFHKDGTRAPLWSPWCLKPITTDVVWNGATTRGEEENPSQRSLAPGQSQNLPSPSFPHTEGPSHSPKWRVFRLPHTPLASVRKNVCCAIMGNVKSPQIRALFLASDFHGYSQWWWRLQSQLECTLEPPFARESTEPRPHPKYAKALV